ncbi:MAG TPA: hypothetical protein VJ417_03705, partial [Candidatus Glassbacteria bacterium]|nr:hypothetical protein [Candidatus Glassbacteria bacterium]
MSISRHQAKACLWVPLTALLLFSLIPAGSLLLAVDATTPIALTTPFPTLINLAVEWEISGDDNFNGRVTVRYRKEGAGAWKEGMPLRRVRAGNSTATSPIFYWKNKHSGSIFDLEPDTGYEIELSLSDPDGGDVVRTVTARTR